MAPRHTQQCGGAACLATALFLVPNKPRTGVLVSLSYPLLTQASTQLYTFSGFGLTLNSHSPPSLPDFPVSAVCGTFLGLFPDCLETFGASGGLQGASGGLWGPLGGLRASGAFGVGVCAFFWGCQALWGASGGLPGPPGTCGAPVWWVSRTLHRPSRGLQALHTPLDSRFGRFRVFGLPPLTPLADPGIQRFQANLLGWSGRVPSGAPGRTPRSTRSLGLGFLNNLRESRKGRSPRQGHCPSTWRCSSRST